MDFTRYAGQTRPWTASDAALVLEVERQTDEELLRAARKESAQRTAARRTPRAVSKPDSPCAHPRTVDEGFWRICLDCGARWLPEVEPPSEEPTEPDDGDR